MKFRLLAHKTYKIAARKGAFVLRFSLCFILSFSQVVSGEDSVSSESTAASTTPSYTDSSSQSSLTSDDLIALRSIQSSYDDTANAALSQMVSAQNDKTECALNEALENAQSGGNKADEDAATAEDDGPSPLLSGLMAAAPSLIPAAMSMFDGTQDRKAQAETQIQTQIQSVKDENELFMQQWGSKGATNPRASVDENGNVSPISSSACSSVTDPQQQILCNQSLKNVKDAANSASSRIYSLNTTKDQSNSMGSQIATSLATGALAYHNQSQQNEAAVEEQQAENDAEAEANDTAAETAAINRQVCELNADEAYNKAKASYDQNEDDRRNALSDFWDAKNGLDDDEETQYGLVDKATDVPVDIEDMDDYTGLLEGGVPIDGGGGALSSLASSTNPSDPAAPDGGGAGGAGSGGAGAGAKNAAGGGKWTFPGQGGPNAGKNLGALTSPGANGSGEGSGNGAGGGGGGFDLYGDESLFGKNDGGTEGANRIPAVSGDGGIMTLIARARQRYSAHAPELVRSITSNRLSMLSDPRKTKQKTNGESVRAPAAQ